jgi:Fe-S-cluster containining protein
MTETIDLITHAATRELRAFTRRTGQPTDVERMDLEPMRQVHEIEITEEHITITYNQQIEFRYNANAIAQREWSYKYNDDPEFVRAIGAVIDLARKHLRDLPENVSCPPGCAECCSGYEPFVSREDVQRIADHLGMGYHEAFKRYVVPRDSADGFVVGYLRKVTDDVADQCVFLKGRGSGHFYCGIYEARPHDCRAFTPIGCEDVDADLPRRGEYKVGAPFRPRHNGAVSRSGRRKTRR